MQINCNRKVTLETFPPRDGRRGCIMLQLSNSQKWILHSCVAFHNVFVLGKRVGLGLQKEGQIGRSHFFSITIARLRTSFTMGRHGDAHSENTLIMGCWHVSGGSYLSEAGKWEQGFQSKPDSEKGMLGRGHKVITIIKSNCSNTRVRLLVVHKQAIPFVWHSCWPLIQKLRRKKSKI